MNKISVSTLVSYLKSKLDSDPNLQCVKVSGELSNFHHHSSGHLYFTLKDEKSQISCVMFASKARLLKFVPKNGDKVVLSANASIFEVSGQLQLYVNSMNLDGIGDLYQRYEELKNKLYEEGFFADEHKKEIPTKYPSKVAVLCGENSAAMSDIKIQFKNRWPICKVDYYPCLVQGEMASKDIIDKLLMVDKLDYEIIILARGGGSFEDLFCFNDEQLVKTIYNLNTFIIDGVGHEQDFTLTDFVSDLRSPTPTACVSMITPMLEEVIEEIDNYREKLINSIDNKVISYKDEINDLANCKYLLDPHNLLDKTKLKFDYYNQKLVSFYHIIERINSNISNSQSMMNINIKKKLLSYSNKINYYKDLLKVYSVDSTLKRGYSIVYKNDKLVNSKNDLKNNDKLKIRLSDGEINSIVKE